MAIAAQGLGRPRPTATVGRRHLRRAMQAVGTIQLDAINVVERTQFLVLFSRLGVYDIDRFHGMTGPGGELFEYWGHAASLLPMDVHPLFRWRMQQDGPYSAGPITAARWRAWGEAHADYVATVLAEIRDRGALTAGQLSDPRRRQGEWWGRRSVGRQALEWLFFKGELAGWRTANFERVYDMPERVIPEAVLSRPTPPVDEAHRQLLALAARSLGVATVGDLGDYYRLKSYAAKARVAELVEGGDLVQVAVEGWGEPGYVAAGARPRRPADGQARLLSPFDSLIWERSRTRRLFGFDYRIEVYVPESGRQYGYYVLPLLVGDELVARLDLKAERKQSALRVEGAFTEPGIDHSTVSVAAAAELDVLREWLGLGRVEVRTRGNLVRELQRAVRASC